jgi:hypothetical protein
MGSRERARVTALHMCKKHAWDASFKDKTESDEHTRSSSDVHPDRRKGQGMKTQVSMEQCDKAATL